ncbi:MAG: hypothetical protein US52_C0065G0005 [candidate division WS6 bacterium GW2011_GWA2_37_6]|uniref:Uncharacterized protein n=1 Tax=candidate division WS6 bacterium GW2011_GWA2_37_6 TaxID=1619087 RepID=A0A0G0H6W1_9BACT|nr:MAG: hypothetical protein US52_C0065G0005 [candidate division WS6 bacterium GW2011_GWA2_37_6]
MNETNSTQDLASNAKLAYAVYCYSNNSLPEGCMPIDQFQSQVIENSAGAAAADAYLGSQLDAHPELRGLIANDVAQRTGADISSWTPSQGLGSIPMSPENRNQFFEAVLTISENSQDFSSLIDNADAYLLDQSLTQELSGIASEYGFDLVTAKTAELNTSTYTFIVQSPDGQYWSMDIVYTNASRQVILDDARAFFASFETDKKGAYYKSFDHLVSSVKAVENLSAKEPGEYQVLGARGENISNRAIIIDRDNVEIRLFNDNNKNGVKDDDEDYLEHVKNFKISKVSDVEKLQLSSGWNSVHLYLIDEKYTKASSLLNELNDAGADIVHIAAYKSGSWSIYTQREGEDVFSNDYYIEPGTGIFIFSREISQITLSGKTYEEKVPIVLEHGWNLVGSNGLDGIDSIELFNSLKNKNIEIGVISDYDSGMYQSIVFENDQVYGNSLKLFKNKGYFISYSGKEEIIYEF